MTAELDHLHDPVDSAPAPASEQAQTGPVAPVPMPADGGLEVGPADDPAERDADRRADEALGRLRRVGTDATPADVEGPEAHQHAPGCDHLRRTNADGQVGLAGGPVPDDTASRIERLRSAGSPLPEPVRRRMETGFGVGFDDVRIHVGAEPDRLNRAVSARAFTTGRDIFFGQGEFAPGTASGDRVLAHELAHTLQPATGPVQRRTTVRRVASSYQSHEDLKDLTLTAFDSYARQQADWATSDDITADKEALRSLLRLARADDELVLGSCGQFDVRDLVAQQIGQGVGTRDADLARYSRDVNAATRVAIRLEEPAAAVDTAVAWGAAIGALEAELGAARLLRALPQTEDAPCLDELVAANRVAALVAYFQAANPVLDAADGSDISSFIEFCTEDGMVLLGDYQASLPEIRNYHRFTKAQLGKLKENRAAGPENPTTGKKLPVCVVLQSGYDTNGAFHRDANMTAVIVRPGYLTVLAEGGRSLAELKGHLATFAAWGVGGKVDEVMIAGHGLAKRMQLTGEPSVATGTYKEVHQRLSVDPTSPAIDRSESVKLIDQIVAVLRDDPESRVVLNACLTASNSVTGKLSADPEAAALEIQQAIVASPSLATAIQQRLGIGHGRVLGANGSFGKVAMLTDSRIDIVSAKDPVLTGSKADYVKSGTDQVGVLCAVLESWSTNRVATNKLVTERVADTAAARGWEQTVIRSLLRIIVKCPDDASLMQRLIAAANALDERDIADECDAEAVEDVRDGLPEAHRAEILEELLTSEDCDDSERLRALLLQVLVMHDDANLPRLHAFLDGSSFTTQSAEGLFALDELDDIIDQLVPIPVAVDSPPRGTFLLALLYLADQEDEAPPEVKQYVAAVAGPNKKFPDTSDVGEILVGLTQNRILQYAGVIPPPGAKVVPPAVANLDPSHSGLNTLTVEPVTWTRRTPADEPAGVYLQPSGDPVAEIPGGTVLHVIGRTTGERKKEPPEPDAEFLAVERTIGAQRTVFVLADEVEEL